MKMYKRTFLPIGILFACSACTSQIEINRHERLSRELIELSKKESELKRQLADAKRELSKAESDLADLKESRYQYLRDKSWR